MNKLLVPTTLVALISTSHALEGTNLLNPGGGYFPGQNNGSTSFDPSRTQLDNLNLAMGLNEVDGQWQPQLMAAQNQIELADVQKRQCETDKSNQIMEAEQAASAAKAAAVGQGVQSGISAIQPMMQNAGHGASAEKTKLEGEIEDFEVTDVEPKNGRLNQTFSTSGIQFLNYSASDQTVTGNTAGCPAGNQVCAAEVNRVALELTKKIKTKNTQLKDASGIGTSLAQGALGLTAAGVPIIMGMKMAADSAKASKQNAEGNYQVCIQNAELAKQQAIRNLNMLNEQYSRAKLNATLADQARRLQQGGDTKNFDVNNPLGAGTIGNLGDMSKLPGSGDKNPASAGGGVGAPAGVPPPGGGGGGSGAGGAGGGDKGSWSFGSLDSKSFQESLPESPGGVALGAPGGGGGAGSGKNNFDDLGKAEGDPKVAAGSLDNALKGELGAAAMVGDGGIRVLMTRARHALEAHAHELMASTRMPATAKAPSAVPPPVQNLKAPIQPTLKSNLQ